MLMKTSLIQFIFVLNLIGNSESVTRKANKVKTFSKTPLKIVASDDEVLQPLFETDFSAIKPVISSQIQARGSRNSKTGKKKKFSSLDERSSLLKMNLDLPSINPNFVASKVVVQSQQNQQSTQNQQNQFNTGSSTKPSPITSLNGRKTETESNKEKVKEFDIVVNFDSPFGNEVIEDVDIVLFRKNAPINVAPKTVIPSSSSSSPLIPGTIIASSSQSIAPGTVIATVDDKQNAPLIPGIATGFDSGNFELENKLPFNDAADNRISTAAVCPPKAKKIRSLDEYSIEGLTFDSTIPGPKIGLDTNITVSFINTTLIPFFKAGKILDRKSSYSIFYRAYQEFLEEETLHEIRLEQGQKIIIFGDIHGQFPDFIKVVEKEGPPSDKLKYIFNGDIVDRGAYSIECLMTLLAYKIAEPKNFFISLGNHETASVGRLQFFKESIRKYGSDEFFKLAHALFKSFPTAYLIQDEVFVTHGGVSPFVTLDRIRQIDRLEPDLEDEDIINDLIWSDPVNTNGTTTSHRGLGFLFGPDITREFVHQNNISVVIRSHQYKEFGFSEQHDGLCITIFSCPNYKAKMKNYGAYIKLDDQLNLTYNIFKAAEINAKVEYPAIPSDLKYSRNVRRVRL